MLVGSEFYGLPQRWAIGLEEMDPSQASTKYPLQSGGVWATQSPDAKFGEFSTGNLEQFVHVINDFRKEIARVSRTPLHYFTMEGNMPSGESMKTADSPLISKVDDRQEAWGMVWSDVMRFALEIAGKGELEPEPVWADTTPRNETTDLANAVTKVKELGVDRRLVLKEIGYSDQQIDEMEPNEQQSEDKDRAGQEQTD
jgi:hypothetical protein